MRCAVMLIYGFKLVVIPFYEEHISTQASTPAQNGTSTDTKPSSIKSEPVAHPDTIKSEKFYTLQAKQTSTSLSSYTIDLRKLDNWLEMRIIDIEFLYGYYEPTLFILCESNMTWVGRYAVKKDTCNSVALSLNLNQKTHPIIWPVDKLPSDVIKCLAVPPPIGGILLFGVNSLIYINQSVPSHGVSLNSIAKATSSYPFKSMESTRITLDSSQSVFIASDRMVLSLKGGEIYIVTLITDSESLRNVKSFSIEKGPGSVIASCLVKCNEGHIFIGSRLGNSVLLKYTAKASQHAPSEELSSSDHHPEPSGVEMSPERARDTDYDELDHILEMNEVKSSTFSDIQSYSFEICDILLNIAPCGYSILGESAGDYSEFESGGGAGSSQFDLVTSSGHTKNGAISVLQRSLRPEVIASFQIPDIVDMWSVFNDSEPSSASHTYLFLSKADSTTVLQLANEITELDKDNSIFCTKSPTLCCSNLAENKFIVQVTAGGMYLYAGCSAESSATGGELVFSLDLMPKLDSRIKLASVCDPYVVVLTEKGAVLVFKLESDRLVELEQSCASNCACLALFKDESRMFSQAGSGSSENRNENDSDETKMDTSRSAAEASSNERDLDDEEELLYGTAHNLNDAGAKGGGDEAASYITKLLTDMEPMKRGALTAAAAAAAAHPLEPEPKLAQAPRIVTFWMLAAGFDGSLAFIKLKESELSLVYTVAKFCLAPRHIPLQNQPKQDDLNTTQAQTAPAPVRSSSLIENTQPYIHELLMLAVGHDKARPMLIARIEEDLIVYEAFLSNAELINLKRVNHEIVIRDKKKRKFQSRKSTFEMGASDAPMDQEFFGKRTKHTQLLRRFESVASYAGFFIAGTHPYLVFFCPRAGLVSHPLWLDQSVLSFVPLRNTSITLAGFVYVNRTFDIRICTLPAEDSNGKLQIYYDSPWVLKKVQIRQTVHFLCYHEESKTYAVVTSVSEPSNKIVQLGGEDKETEAFEKEEGFILPNKSQFFIQLYTPNGWEMLPLGKYTLAEWEHVSCLKLVSLPYEGHSSGFRSYLAASTVNCYNEDVNTRGRVLIFDVIEAVPEPGQPLTAIKMKTILEKDQKGPVTCLESVGGYLLGGVGQKMFIWEYKNNELLGKAFIDTHFFIHKMVTLKNFVLIADLHKSISLIRFQQEYTKLSYVAKVGFKS